MKNIIIMFTMTFLSVSTASLGRAVETAPQENLSSLINFALANNPEIKTSTARWQMFTNRIAMARSFEDPMLMLKIQKGLESGALPEVIYGRNEPSLIHLHRSINTALAEAGAGRGGGRGRYAGSMVCVMRSSRFSARGRWPRRR